TPATGPATNPATGPATRPAGAARPAADRLLSIEELKQLFDEEKFADCIKGINRAAELRGKAAEQYDRFELFMLKAECHFKLKAQPAVLA
ncbi:hypothetical protein, partial [Escherichia coli]|uniref:hypothetical protein n=1 Tax=Escherichia coli TaxID=562 RepID=UPI001C5899D7